jgi:hypothetical protein
MLGGRGTDPSHYCKVTTYLQHHAPRLFENIQDLCLFGIFNTSRKREVTLLLPSEADQKKIDKMVGTDATQAVNMIKALVIPSYLDSLSKFNGDVVNSLGQTLDIVESKKTSVTLKGDITITPVAAFKRLYNDSKQAIYSISGLIPTDGKKAKVNKTGAYSGGNDTELKAAIHENGKGVECRTVFKALESMCSAALAMGGTDPTILASMSIKYKNKNTSKGIVMKNLTTTSPLANFIFDYFIDKESGKEWASGLEGKYKKTEEWKEQSDVSPPANYYPLKNKIALNMMVRGSPTATELAGTISNMFDACYENLDQKVKDECIKVFNTKDAACNWWRAKCEFSHLFGVKWMQAWINNREGGITKIMNYFLHHYIDYASATEFKKCVYLTSDVVSENTIGSQTPYYCAMLAFALSQSCCAAGGTPESWGSSFEPTEGRRPNNVKPHAPTTLINKYLTSAQKF